MFSTTLIRHRVYSPDFTPACGIFPLNCIQMSERLPSVNRDPGDECTSSALNDMVLNF